jgi:DNA-binding NarL/FixJ family response regulator
MALMAAQRGDRAGAERAYGLAGPPASWLPSPALLLSVWGHGLPVAIELGRTDDVEFLAGQFEPFRGQHVANGAGSGMYMGPIELRLGQAYAALGLLDQAVADLEHAVAACSANGARGYAVEASLDLAAALVRRAAGADRDVDRVEAILDRAAAEADRLAMAPFIARVEALRGADPRTPAAPSTTSSASQLTSRETEVAALVAGGLTNRQIAETLFIAERTAENHVQHILTKLGLANRTQIATWVPSSK